MAFKEGKVSMGADTRQSLGPRAPHTLYMVISRLFSAPAFLGRACGSAGRRTACQLIVGSCIVLSTTRVIVLSNCDVHQIENQKARRLCLRGMSSIIISVCAFCTFVSKKKLKNESRMCDVQCSMTTE